MKIPLPPKRAQRKAMVVKKTPSSPVPEVRREVPRPAAYAEIKEQMRLVLDGIDDPIAGELGLSRPATSRQLRLLTEAGLLRWTWSRLDRRSRYYVIDPGMHGPITAWLAGVEVGRTAAWFSPSWSTHVGRRHAPAGDSSPRGDGSA